MVLGIVHLGNVWVFNRIRRHTAIERQWAPVGDVVGETAPGPGPRPRPLIRRTASLGDAACPVCRRRTPLGGPSADARAGRPRAGRQRRGSVPCSPCSTTSPRWAGDHGRRRRRGDIQGRVGMDRRPVGRGLDSAARQRRRNGPQAPVVRRAQGGDRAGAPSWSAKRGRPRRSMAAARSSGVAVTGRAAPRRANPLDHHRRRPRAVP